MCHTKTPTQRAASALGSEQKQKEENELHKERRECSALSVGEVSFKAVVMKRKKCSQHYHGAEGWTLKVIGNSILLDHTTHADHDHVSDIGCIYTENITLFATLRIHFFMVMARSDNNFCTNILHNVYTNSLGASDIQGLSHYIWLVFYIKISEPWQKKNPSEKRASREAIRVHFRNPIQQRWWSIRHDNRERGNRYLQSCIDVHNFV